MAGLMLSLRSAMPIITRSRSTCSGSVPDGGTRSAWLANWTAAESGVLGSISISHLMRSTLDGSVDDILSDVHRAPACARGSRQEQSSNFSVRYRLSRLQSTFLAL